MNNNDIFRKLSNYRLLKLVRSGIIFNNDSNKSKAFEALRILKNRLK